MPPFQGFLYFHGDNLERRDESLHWLNYALTGLIASHRRVRQDAKHNAAHFGACPYLLDYLSILYRCLPDNNLKKNVFRGGKKRQAYRAERHQGLAPSAVPAPEYLENVSHYRLGVSHTLVVVQLTLVR